MIYILLKKERERERESGLLEFTENFCDDPAGKFFRKR